jgi:hypothetical protein
MMVHERHLPPQVPIVEAVLVELNQQMVETGSK